MPRSPKLPNATATRRNLRLSDRALPSRQRRKGHAAISIACAPTTNRSAATAATAIRSSASSRRRNAPALLSACGKWKPISASCNARQPFRTATSSGASSSRRPSANIAAPALRRRRGSQNFFEQLFGGSQSNNDQVRANEGPIVDDNQGRLGGSRVVCVRTCDGFFFPLPAGGREGAQEMCQALCPEAETQVFYMAPEGDIERGVSASGQPYASLANASRYRKTVVPNCGCRKEGEKWVDALQRAEDLLDRRKTDIVVTTQKAEEELSRPKAEVAKKAPDPKGKKAGSPPVQAQGKQAPGQQGAVQQPVAEPDPEQAVDTAAVPTASKESAGIGPQNVGKDKTVGQREGQVVEMTGQDGKRQKVRVVAPNMFVSPQSSPTR